MTTRYKVTLVVEHDPELSRDRIAEALPTVLGGTGLLFERKPSTTDAEARNQTIDPRSLCFSAVLDAVEVT